MIPPDLLAQQIHAVQTLGYPPSPRGPYVRPCYFIRPDQGQVMQAWDFFRITRVLSRIFIHDKNETCSVDSKLQLSSICSIRILSVTKDNLKGLNPSKRLK